MHLMGLYYQARWRWFNKIVSIEGHSFAFEKFVYCNFCSAINRKLNYVLVFFLYLLNNIYICFCMVRLFTSVLFYHGFYFWFVSPCFFARACMCKPTIRANALFILNFKCFDLINKSLWIWLLLFIRENVYKKQWPTYNLIIEITVIKSFFFIYSPQKNSFSFHLFYLFILFFCSKCLFMINLLKSITYLYKAFFSTSFH